MLENISDSEDMKKMKELLDEDCKNVQAFAKNEKYTELPMLEECLRNKQYEKAFNQYREKIMNILYKGKIIRVGKRFLDKEKGLKEYDVTQEIVGAYYYYEHPDRKENVNKKRIWLKKQISEKHLWMLLCP